MTSSQIIALITVACLFLRSGATDKFPKRSVSDEDNQLLVKDIAWQSADSGIEILRSSLTGQQMKQHVKEKLSTAINEHLLVNGEEAKQGFFLKRTNGRSSQASRLLKRDGDISHASSMTQRSAGNVCLQPPDPLRTCFRRAIDPDNHYGCDFVDRKQYNYERKRGILPYLDADEEVFYGKLIISMIDNEHNLNSCDSRLRMEELLLTFLADNIGSPDTFTPICAYMTEYMFDLQDVPETDNDISGTAFHFDITFAQFSRVPNWRRLENSVEGDEEEDKVDSTAHLQSVFTNRDLRKDMKRKKNKKDRGGRKNRVKDNKKNKNGSNGMKDSRRKDSGKNNRNKTKDKTKKNVKDKVKNSVRPTNVIHCRATDQAMCCAQRAINGSPGAHCTELGCDLSLCGSGRKSFQPIDDTWKGGDWSGEDNNGWSGRQRKLNNFVRTKGSRKLSGWSKPAPSWYDNFSGQSTKSHNPEGYYCPAYGFLNSGDNDDNFNTAVNVLTPYNARQTYSQLDIDFLFADSCSINRYSLDRYDLPTLVCTTFRDEACEQNNDLLPPVEDYYPVVCIDDSTYRKYSPSSVASLMVRKLTKTLLIIPTAPTLSPTAFPTETPTSSPSVSPTSLPSSSPTASPSNLPTSHPSDHPTYSPSESPSSAPSSSPTGDPTKLPTARPTKLPTARPTKRPTNRLVVVVANVRIFLCNELH